MTPAGRANDARGAAVRVLERVERERSFAAPVLEAELTRNVQLLPRDRALATELTYGTLRVQPWLGQRVARFAPRGIEKLDPRVRAHLLVAAYQLFFTRVPAFAAVSEAVRAVIAARGARVGAFANAVLRKVASDAAGVTDEDRAEALVASAPAWLREALGRALGESGARAFLTCGLEPPPVGIRVEEATERGAWLARLRDAAAEARFEPGAVSPLCILSRGAGKPQRLPGWSDGAWSVQEEGSQLAALAVGARPGERILDACAGRGNKTAILARQAGAPGAIAAVDACDAMPAKLDRLREELARVGLAPHATFAVDWRVGSGDVRDVYDRVLVDAPCSGVGTLRRRPEIALRREPFDLRDLAAAQTAIAIRAAGHVRPGGSLVYVVCSVLREESEDVVDAVLRARPELEPAPFDAPEALAIAGVSSSFRLLPHVHATDGYFVARLRSRATTL
ncbi:MAG: Sun protein [Polyangiaceae bacterium]|nr:Sun protein [Polyangiaceae bacterium]